YQAEDLNLGRQVALKFLPSDLERDPAALERFQREARAASALNHSNICTIYEIGQADGRYFIATELIRGETLRARLQRAPLTLRETLDVAVQIASALNAAHAAGIVHRDIKPENVMLRDDGLAKVLDFGLAKLTDRKAGSLDSEGETRALAVNTAPGTVMGTVAYMSPEQARGREIDARSDVWSLGVVAYEMLTRRTPFAGETASDTIAAILTREPAPLDESAPPELQRIIRKALQKDRDERYQTVKDLLLDLKNLKRELDFAEEIERSQIPHFAGAANVGTSQLVENATAMLPAATSTQNSPPQPTSSAEYLVSEIKRHRRGMALGAIMLLALLGAGSWFLFNRAPGNKQIESIAVMPFVNEGGNADTEYLSDGMTETLIGSLSRLPNVSVKARSSVFRYKGKEVDPKKIASELNVQAILNGRVAQRGDQLTLGLELIDARTENVIWSEQYNRQQSDLVSLQSEIARDVSSKLRLKLSGADEQKLNKVYTTNPDAYQLYLKGQFYWNKLTPEAQSRSLDFYQQAIDKDPAFALAYVGISDAYMVLGIPDVMLGTLPPQESLRNARNAADKALEIDPTLAEAYASRAHVKWKGHDWAGADEDFKYSIGLNGNYPNAHRFYSIYLASASRSEEAIREVRRAEELEPLSVGVKAHAAYIFYFARRYDEAIENGKTAVEMDATSPVAHQRLGAAYEQKGMFPEAIAEFQKAVDGSNRIQLAVASLAHAYALAGRRAEAEKLLAELKERSGREYVSSYLVAEIYTALGEKEAAIKSLERAYDEQSIDLVLAKVDPRLDPLRDDPRYQELLKKVGFPQ
ncbi:MAG: protein kinase domain-containing protein, partial [Pyrinomonadaceae bacterium]